MTDCSVVRSVPRLHLILGLFLVTGLGDLSSFASLAANLQNNPEAFNTLSNMMNNISGGGGSSNMMGGGGSGGMMGKELRLCTAAIN